MIIEASVVAGYVIAWALRKARRVADRADAGVDAAMDAMLDRLEVAVRDKLGAGSVLDKVLTEVAAPAGQVSPAVRQRLEDDLTAAAEDAQWARKVAELTERLRQAESSAQGGRIANTFIGNQYAIGQFSGTFNVNSPNPSQPDR